MPERPRPTPGEIEGATESEESEAEVSRAAETAAAARPERVTPERRGFWSRFFRRQRPQTAEEVEVEARKAEQEAARVERGAAIALGEKPPLQFGALTQGEIREMMQDPERLPDLIEHLSPEQFRQMQMESIHGSGRMARWREYTSGDHEIELGENGEIRRDSVKELKRRGRGVLLKALPGAALLIAGCFTAGATLPAAGAVLGSLVGSGAAEAWEALQGKRGLNGLREQIAKVLYSHLIELRDHAKKYKEAKESGNEEEAYKYLEMVVSKFHEASEKAKEIHCQFLEKRKRWDRFKGIAAAIGGLAGLAAGALGFAHHLDLDKLKGAGELSKHGLKQTHHWVRRINGAWQFMYGQGEPLPGHVARTVFESGGQTWHTIGPHQAGATWEILKKGLAVIGAGAVAAIAQGIYRRGDKARFEEEWAMTKEEQERHQALLGRRMPARPEPSGGAEARAETGVFPEQQKYAELAQRERKTLPAPDQIWFMIGEDGKPIFFRIKSIDWKTGKATIDYLGFMAPGAVGAGLKPIQENEIKDLEDIIRNWTSREDYAKSWAKAIKDGDIIVVLAGRSKVTDRYDPSRKHRLKPGQYRFKRIGEEGDLEAELIDQTDDPDRKGNRAKVSIFDLAWAGVVPKEAQREERRVAKPLAERQLWVLKDGVGINDVPEELRALAEHGIYINEIENPNDIENSTIHVYGVDENGRRLTGANRRIRDVSAVLLRQYFRYAETATGGGGGREQQQQRGAGGGGARNRQGGGGAGGGGERGGAGGGERRT